MKTAARNSFLTAVFIYSNLLLFFGVLNLAFSDSIGKIDQ